MPAVKSKLFFAVIFINNIIALLAVKNTFCAVLAKWAGGHSLILTKTSNALYIPQIEFRH